MILTIIKIDGATYGLAPDQDLGLIKSAVISAAQAGAGLVEFQAVGGRGVVALITPATSVVLEEREIAEEPDEDGGGESISALHFLDFDGQL